MHSGYGASFFDLETFPGGFGNVPYEVCQMNLACRGVFHGSRWYKKYEAPQIEGVHNRF
jgi:hypothetical protein